METLPHARADLDRYIREVRPLFEEMLAQMVGIPTVSAQPERNKDIRAGARLAAQLLQSHGAEARIVETKGNPVVVGEMVLDRFFPTITIYNHLDVQPAEEPQWTRDPFVCEVKDGVYRGRGTTDDKGPALTALLAAKFAVQRGVRLNIRFVWELEEEIGSPNFESFVAQHQEELATGSVLVSDTIWISREVPAVPYGLRGMQLALLKLQTAERDAHSGLVGGAARNPVAELCQVLDRCFDARTGRVHVPGFYNGVAVIGQEEIQSFLASGFTVEAFKKGHQLTRLRTEEAAEVMRRIWCQPTFEVHGITGGYTGPGVKTVVPHRAEAKVSMRLVPDQDPAAIFALLKAFVHEVNPDVEVESAGSLSPFLGQFSGPYAEAVQIAIRDAFGREPAFIREGGSIGTVVTMQRLLKVPIMFLGLSLPEHGYHAPNECFDWGQASGGIKAMVRYFEEVSRVGRG